MNNKQKFTVGGVALFAVAIGLGLTGLSNDYSASVEKTPEPTTTTETVTTNTVTVSETGTGIVVTKAEDWATTFPNQYNSFAKNDENNEVVEYLDESPYLKTLYEGYGFAISYGSARGHTYVIEDLYATGRPHALANCFTCKTSDFTAKVLNDGDSAYAMEFESFKSEVQDPFGCFHCHENTPSSNLYVTHGYLADALGDDIANVPAADLTCAQCHTEYYFNPETKAVTLGYTSLADMTPADILANENAIVDTEGNQFADWVDESTGVRKLKAQHPEFETYFGAGSIHTSMNLTCADCHMGTATADDGTTYTNHYWVSPLQSEDILNNTCAQCHSVGTLQEKVETIQLATRAREDEIGLKLAELDEKLTEAVNNNTLSEEDLETVRSLNRDAQFLWDFIYVENSEGAHNTSLTNKTLDQAEDLVDQALDMLK